MALSNTTVKQTYSGDGSTTTFAIPFAFAVDANSSSETLVYIRDESDANDITETLQTEGAMNDYTLTTGSPPTNVEFNSAPAATDKVVIIRTVPKTQTTDLDESQALPVEDLENELDRIVAQIQELKEEVDRMPKLRVTEQFGDTTLDQPFADNLIGVNADNDGFEFKTPSEVLADATAGITAQGTTTTITDSNGTPTDITDLVLDSSSYSGAIAFCRYTRGGGTTGGFLILALWYVNSTWYVKDSLDIGDGHGLTFTITSAGQVQYTSDSSGAGTFDHRFVEFT